MPQLNCLSSGGDLRDSIVDDISLTNSVSHTALSTLFSCVLQYVARTGGVTRALLAGTVDRLGAGGTAGQLQLLQRLAKALLAFSKLAVNCRLESSQLAADLAALSVENVCIDVMVEVWQRQFPSFSRGDVVDCGGVSTTVSDRSDVLPGSNEDNLCDSVGVKEGDNSTGVSVLTSSAAKLAINDGDINIPTSDEKQSSKLVMVQISFMSKLQSCIESSCGPHSGYVRSDLIASSGKRPYDSNLIDSSCRLAVVTGSCGESDSCVEADSRSYVYVQILLQFCGRKQSKNADNSYTRCLQLDFGQVNSLIEQLESKLH